MARLYTFHISHFSEKARWALDRTGVDYEELPLLPGPHVITVRRLGGRTSVPLWVDESGRTIQDSSAIVDHADELGAGLTPDDPRQAEEARAIERLADEAFGLGTQQLFYAAMLDDPAMLTRAWAPEGPWWAGPLYRAARPVIASRVRALYRIRPATVDTARRRFREALDQLDERLGDKEYLVGDRFSRADLTVSALLALSVRPPEHRLRWFELPAVIEDFIAEHESRPIFELVRRMYQRERSVTLRQKA